MPDPAGLTSALTALDAQGLRRRRRLLESAAGAHVRIEGRHCVSFASNDYLGLANHPDMKAAAAAALAEHGVGAAASHLLGGHHAAHARLEAELAAFIGRPAALLFSTGYLANLGVITALVGRDGAIFADRLNHASLIDAAILSRAVHRRYPHLDLARLEAELAASPARVKLIVSDGVFSMDGDIAPLPDLLKLADRYGAWLLIDDAHGFGVLGQDGRGVLQHFDLANAPSGLIYLATLGKAAGVAGAFIAGDTTLIDWLVNRARSYLYTTASPPALAAAASVSLRLIASEPERRQRLRRHIEVLRAGLAGLPWPLLPSATPIQPLLVGDTASAVRLSAALWQRGLYVPAIRPPTVPAGHARLRISLSAAHSEADVAALIDALHAIAADFGQ